MKRNIHALFTCLFIFVVCAALLAPPAMAGKKDDTLNVAFTKELESLDRYFNTAREGIVRLGLFGATGEIAFDDVRIKAEAR